MLALCEFFLRRLPIFWRVNVAEHTWPEAAFREFQFVHHMNWKSREHCINLIATRNQGLLCRKQKLLPIHSAQWFKMSADSRHSHYRSALHSRCDQELQESGLQKRQIDSDY